MGTAIRRPGGAEAPYVQGLAQCIGCDMAAGRVGRVGREVDGVDVAGAAERSMHAEAAVATKDVEDTGVGGMAADELPVRPLVEEVAGLLPAHRIGGHGRAGLEERHRLLGHRTGDDRAVAEPVGGRGLDRSGQPQDDAGR